MILYRHEMKMNLKSLLIWTLCVGGLCFGCILLYGSLEDSIQGMAQSYSDLGAMSVALGMDKMSLATLTGYYATEIAMMHGLGGAMFAAILGSGLLSKEEAGHTSEFLNVLPVGRRSVVLQKYLALISNLLIFNLVCVMMYLLGFYALGETVSAKEMTLYHLAALVMQTEIATVCFLLSACTKRILIGAGLGVSVLMFALDMMCRIVPAIENLKYVTPFYYANAADIFSAGKINAVCLLIAAAVILCSLAAAVFCYRTKDLAS